MADVIIMPKLGYNMDEGQLVKWCKKVGESVAKGEVLFEINTDKTTMPVEATADAVVLKLLIEEGDYAPVFTPIAVVGAAGEDADAALKNYKPEGEEEAPVQEPAEPVKEEAASIATVAEEVIDIKSLKLTPKAKKFIKDTGLSLSLIKNVKGTGYEGGITYADIKDVKMSADGPKASPVAKNLAAKEGIDLSAVQGSGVNGKIMKADVASKIAPQAAVAPAPVTAAPQAAPLDSEEKKILKTVPYKGVRKVIGDRLSQSKFTAPHLYFTNEVDTTKFTAFRKELNENSEVKISATDLLVVAASKALQKYPEVNSSLVDGNIVTYKSTNVGVAVAGNNGLIVPVIKNAQEKTLTAIAQETKDLFNRARDGKLAAEEYSGGTFSVSNLGMFGIGNFTAIINPPEAAILSVSSIIKKPVVITNADGEDEIAIRPMMNIQLTVDHRLIDGLMAAQFVGYMKELIENPLKILM